MSMMYYYITLAMCRYYFNVSTINVKPMYLWKIYKFVNTYIVTTLKQMENMATEKPKNEKQIKRDYYRLKRYFYNFM